MALQLANRYKTVLAAHHSNMESALVRMLDKMECVVNQSKCVELKMGTVVNSNYYECF